MSTLAGTVAFVVGMSVPSTVPAQPEPTDPPELPPETPPEPPGTPDEPPEPPTDPPPESPPEVPPETPPETPPPPPTTPPPVPPPATTAPPPPPPPTAPPPPAPPPTTTAPPPSPPYPPAQPYPAQPYPPPQPYPAQPYPAQSPPPAPPPNAGDETKDDEEDTGGIFGPIRLGPYVGTGLPNVLNFGGTVKFFDYLGGGINFGMIPDIKVSMYGDAELKYREYDIFGRLYPFGGGFFLGAGVGYHSVEGTFSKTVEVPQLGSFTATSHGSVKAMILTPQIGWFSIFGSGFALGIDIGAQVPIAPSTIELENNLPANIPQQYVDQSNEEVLDTLDKLGKTVVPVLNVRLGFML